MIQSLPPADENSLSHIEKEIDQLPFPSQFFMSGNDPGDILSTLFKRVPHKKTGSRKLFYSCSCSKTKMKSALFSLGYDDLSQLLQKEGRAEVHCQFCRDSYIFDSDELEAILATDSQRKN